jgi:type I restriction enzyme M protein
MDNTSLQNLLKRLCKVMWESNVTDPLTYVTQIAYLLFLKMLEEMDADQTGHTKRELFTKITLDGEEVDFAKLRWSVLTSDPDNERMLRTLRDLLPRFALHPGLSPGARAIFDDARIVIPDGGTLRRAVDLISPIHLLSEDADVKGDLFETLSSDLGQQKRSAQFRTPRHLIRVIVEMVNPEIGKTVCDSACGTGGFLIAAYEHILLANTSPDFIREVATPGGLIAKRGVGDKLSPSQWEFLQKQTLHGFDGEQTFVRMTAMNALLHGFDYSPIVRRDSIGGSEDRWDEVQFDYILENPPFSGAGQSPKRSLRVEKGEKYVLFLAAALRSLKPGGRAGIILPNGILFGDTNAHLEVKRRLLTEYDLQAVVMLPKGMFEPYTPNSTCFLIFQKTGRPTDNVWFYRVEGDGSSLKKARKFGPQYKNDFPDLLAKWPKRETETDRAWCVPAHRIIENGYNMALASLGLVELEKTDHPEPEGILAGVAEKERRILEIMEEMIAFRLRPSDKNGDHGWPMRPLSDVAEIVMGQSPEGGSYNTAKTGTPLLNGPTEFGEKHPTPIQWTRAPTRLCKKGDILFCVRGSTTGRMNIADQVYCLGRGLAAIRAKSDLCEPRYLSWALTCLASNVVHRADDGVFPNLDKKELLGFKMPIAPLEDQRRIVAILDTLASKFDELRQLQTETEEMLAAFTPSLLSKAFSGAL